MNERDRRVYLIAAMNDESIEAVKIGDTTDHKRRINNLQVGNHRRLKLMRLYSIGPAEVLEKTLKKRLVEKHLSGEWYALDKDDIRNIDEFVYYEFSDVWAENHLKLREEAG